ncbi:MAG: hypothetical protein NTU83_09530 [Candidatus Hydrogenedentes bacterium]|nr:hypothetical protein [Candidatus Hydrogenedentota bacterium]
MTPVGKRARFFFCLMLAAFPAKAGDVLDSWPHGALGYQESLQRATETEQPLILFFHSKDCPFSKRFIADYLPDKALRTFFDSAIKAEIDPFAGDVEKSVTEQDYSITSFPTIVVTVPAFGTKVRKLNPLRKDAPDWTPAQFLQKVKSAIAEFYDEKAYSFDKTQDYEKALKYLGFALEYDPDNVYANKAAGACYLALAKKSQDHGLLEKAEAAFAKAQQLDPSDKTAAGALAAIRGLK